MQSSPHILHPDDSRFPPSWCAQFLSVPQKGPTGEARSELDAALFTRALRNMMVWYSHPKILTLKLTALPPGYPDGFTFTLGITPNTASYFERGW